MDKETMKIVVVSLVLLVFVLALAFIVSRLVKKAVEKRRLRAEEGREALNEENQEASERQAKALKVAAIGYLVVYGLFIIAGITSIIIFVHKLRAGKKVLEIIGSDRGFYVLAPVAMLWSIYSLLKLVVKGRNK